MLPLEKCVSDLTPVEIYNDALREMGRAFMDARAYGYDEDEQSIKEIIEWLKITANVHEFPGVRESYVWCQLLEAYAPWDTDKKLTGQWVATSINYFINQILGRPEEACGSLNTGVAMACLTNKLFQHPDIISHAVEAGLDIATWDHCLKTHEDLINASVLNFHGSNPDDTDGVIYYFQTLIYRAIMEGGYTPAQDPNELYDLMWNFLPHLPFYKTPSLNNEYEINRLLELRPFSLGPLLQAISKSEVYDWSYHGLLTLDITRCPVHEIMRGFLEVYHYREHSDGVLWAHISQSWPAYAELITLHAQLYDDEKVSYAQLDGVARSWQNLNLQQHDVLDSLLLPELN